VEFDEEYKVRVETLNATEAQAFLAFLGEERDRHIECIRDAEDNEIVMDGYGMDEEQQQFQLAYNEFYRSAKERHVSDVMGIDKLVREVKDRFHLWRENDWNG
jgi:hypothetical protein